MNNPPQNNNNTNTNTNQNMINLGDWDAFNINSGPNGVNMESTSQNNSSKDINQVDPNLLNVFSKKNNSFLQFR
jgi:hypothetical protein